jgi:hypothetical protein
MDTTHEYKFRIDAYTPATMPMSRLAEYMQDLAALLGEKEHVHFVRLDPGSTVLVQQIDRESVPRVHARVSAINVTEGEGPEDALRAFKALDRRLAEDNATGHLCTGDGAEIIRFPGCEKAKPLTFGAFTQPGSLDGLLIKIGGKDETVPAHIQEGDTVYICNATREMARRLAPHLFAATLRVHGNGRWERDAEGNWNLKRFNIAEFEVLEDAPLSEVVARLRQVQGCGWKEIDDPYTELQHLRQGPEEAH